jgi:hypothetical protein
MSSISQQIDVISGVEPLWSTGCSDAERAQAVHRVLIVGSSKRFRPQTDWSPSISGLTSRSPSCPSYTLWQWESFCDVLIGQTVKVHLIFFHYHLTTLPVVLYIYIVKILPPQTNAKVMESIVQWDGRLPVLTDAMWIQVWEDRIHMALPKNGRKIPWLMVDLRFPILLVTILYGFSRKFSILGMHSRPWTFRREQCWAASGGRCAAQLAAPTGGN